jgi:hypothetical protein
MLSYSCTLPSPYYHGDVFIVLYLLPVCCTNTFEWHSSRRLRSVTGSGLTALWVLGGRSGCVSLVGTWSSFGFGNGGMGVTGKFEGTASAWRSCPPWVMRSSSALSARSLAVIVRMFSAFGSGGPRKVLPTRMHSFDFGPLTLAEVNGVASAAMLHCKASEVSDTFCFFVLSVWWRCSSSNSYW